MDSDAEFERLLSEAEVRPFFGWDFSFLSGRMREDGLDWDYLHLVRPHLTEVVAVLDLGTGGGEILAGLAPLPRRAVATEAYAPNLAVAHRRLAPLGVTVVAVDGAPDNANMLQGHGVGSLPFADAAFPLIIDRHESFYPAEVHRLLEPGGRFITQQVGGDHLHDLNKLLKAPLGMDPRWDLAFAVRQLEDAGLEIVDTREAFPTTIFRDIGAVAYYLKAVSWQAPGFTVSAYRERLAELYAQMVGEGPLQVHGHFFYVEAIKPF